MNASCEPDSAAIDTSRPISRRAVVLSLLSLPAALAGCGGGGDGASPSPPPSAPPLPQGYTLAYRVDPPGASEGRISTAVDLMREGTLLLTQVIPREGIIISSEPERVLTSFTNFGRPQDSVSREVLRVPVMEFVPGGFYYGDPRIVMGVTSTNEIYVPGSLLVQAGIASPPTFYVLSARGEVRRSVTSNLPTTGGIRDIVECPDGTFVGLGAISERELIVRMDARGNYLNTVMEGASVNEQYTYSTTLHFRFKTPTVTPSGDVYVFCYRGNSLDEMRDEEGFLTAKLDGSGLRFIPIQHPLEFARRNVMVQGATLSDDAGNLYVEARRGETYPNRYPGEEGDTFSETQLRNAVHKFAPDGTELGVAILPDNTRALANPNVDAAVDGSGNIYTIHDDGAIYVYNRTR